MTRRLRPIVLAAAVLPLVVLVGLRSAWAAYACQVDGEVRSACCCPKKPKTERPRIDEPPRMLTADCCDVSTGETSTAPQAREAERLQTNDAPVAFIATVVAASVPATHGARAPSRNQLARPPPRTLPTYLENLTILR